MTGTVATASDPSAAPGATGQTTRRARWSHPQQRMLLVASIGIIVGSFMPWIETGIGTFHGFAGPGLYLFYAGVLGLGGALVPLRWPAVIQAGLLAAVAIALPLWQIVKLLARVGFQGWTPGFGLMIVLGCGVWAAQIAVRLARPTAH